MARAHLAALDTSHGAVQSASAQTAMHFAAERASQGKVRTSKWLHVAAQTRVARRAARRQKVQEEESIRRMVTSVKNKDRGVRREQVH